MIPTWDEYFLDICDTISKNSKCLSRRVGSIIVRNKSIVSAGYNGPPSGIPHCSERIHFDNILCNLYMKKYKLSKKPLPSFSLSKCPRQELGFKSGDGLYLCTASHSERNAIVNAAKNGISVDNCIMYVNCNVPCFDCLKEIINSGIKEIVCKNHLSYYDSMSEFLLNNSNIMIRSYFS